jgi:hypothetical protein
VYFQERRQAGLWPFGSERGRVRSSPQSAKEEVIDAHRRVRTAHLCTVLPSEPCVRIISAHGSSNSLRILGPLFSGVDLLVAVEV